MMQPIVPLAICLWVPAIVWLFGKFGPQRSIIFAVVAGMLFLPELSDVPRNVESPQAVSCFLLPFVLLTKLNIISLSVLLAALVHDRKRLLSYRLRLFDLPMLLWCLCPLLSALTNDPPTSVQHKDFAKFGYWGPVYLGPLHDGLSQVFVQVLTWGVPYFIGRLYFNEPEAIKELALGMLIGGLIYVPLCLIEWKFSPLFHRVIYRFDPHEAGQAYRAGHWQPVVFMEDGTAVALWLSASLLLAGWFWWTGALKSIQLPYLAVSVPTLGLLLLLLATLFLSKSGLPCVLALFGLVCLLAISKLGPRPVILVLVLLGPLYLLGRLTSSSEATGWTKTIYNRWENQHELEELEQKSLDKKMFSWAWWSSKEMASFVSTDRDRQAVVSFQLINEDRAMEKTRERPWFGWGGWDRSQIPVLEGESGDEKVYSLLTFNSLWISTYANRGAVGLVLLYIAMLLPVIRFAWIYPRPYWTSPMFAAAAGGTIIVSLWMLDNLFSNSFNPVYVLLAGGIAGLTLVDKPLPLDPLPVATATLPQHVATPSVAPVNAD